MTHIIPSIIAYHFRMSRPYNINMLLEKCAPAQTHRIREFENIIVGGGITGTAAAYFLAKEGKEVALCEQFDLNTQASGRNAGSLHGQIQFDPFHKLGFEWAKSFLPALKFLADSLDMWTNLASDLGTDLEVFRGGGLLVAETKAEMTLLSTKVELEQTLGIAAELLTGDQLRQKAPYISEKMLGAAYSPIEGKANPLLAAPAFAEAAKKHGAKIFTGVEVFSITKESNGYRLMTSDGDFLCKNVLLTSNAGLTKLGTNFGLSLPISDEPVQVSVSEIVSPFVKHLIYFSGERLTFKQAKSGSLLIGGGWPARINSEGIPVLNPDSLRANMRVAIKVVPSIAEVKIIRTWIGVGNGTPDHRPIIGEVEGYKGVFIGMFPGMGFSAGPLLGKVLADLATEQIINRNLEAFSISRFH
jgi:sarcosine oxidase, subunit beta